MAFTKDDKEYLGLITKPLADGISELKQQFKEHDNETGVIDKVQQQMLGAVKILGWTVLPVFVSIVTWYFTSK